MAKESFDSFAKTSHSCARMKRFMRDIETLEKIDMNKSVTNKNVIEEDPLNSTFCSIILIISPNCFSLHTK